MMSKEVVPAAPGGTKDERAETQATEKAVADDVSLPPHIRRLQADHAKREAKRRSLALAHESTIPKGSEVEPAWQAAPHVRDAHGMPLPEVMQMETWELIEATLPEQLAVAVRQYREENDIVLPTPTQRVTIPLAFEGRDVVCVAPTGSGKTLAYLIPPIAQVLRERSKEQIGLGYNPAQEKSATEISRELKERKMKTCRYCGLDMSKAKICPETGAPHPPIAAIATFEQIEKISDVTCAACGHDMRRSRICEATGERHNYVPKHRLEKSLDKRKEISDIICAPKILVLVPTIELVHQVFEVAKKIACDLQVGKLHTHYQDEESRDKILQSLPDCDILVTTPLRFASARHELVVSAKQVRVCIMDEFDQLFSRDTYVALVWCMKSLPMQAMRAQRLLFSATMPKRVEEHMKQPMLALNHCVVRSNAVGEGFATRNSNIHHHVLMLHSHDKINKIIQMFDDGTLLPEDGTIIFTNASAMLTVIAEKLTERMLPKHPEVKIGFAFREASKSSLQSDIVAFNAGSINLLLCTDLVCRGIDFVGARNVIHYHIPRVIERYTHRCGRVGRRGKEGHSFAFFCREDAGMAKELHRILASQNQPVPAKLVEYSEMSETDIFAKLVRPSLSRRNHGTNPEYARADYLKTRPSIYTPANFAVERKERSAETQKYAVDYPRQYPQSSS